MVRENFIMPMFESSSSAHFPTTSWSRVARAGNQSDPEAKAALEGLCRDYWYPLYAFVRRQGFSPDDAGDLVQGFLADLLERRDLAGADRDRGRFRSFLRSACAHYLSHQRERDRALKRGGAQRPISIDMPDAEGRYRHEPVHELTAARLFERRWALDLLGHVLTRLEGEATQSGKGRLFGCLRPMLEGDDRAESYRDVAAAVGLSTGAVKVAAYRLRARYRELLREEVGRTVDDPAEVDAELTDLITALAD
jgi:DNA-directed RNA polymerase specialized sigma24 family protein